MIGSIQLRQISDEQIAAHNTLYCAPLAFETTWLESLWHWTFQLTSMPDAYPVHIMVDWGEGRATFRAGLDWLDKVTGSLLGQTAIGNLPPQVQIALAETTFSELADQVETLSKKPLRIQSVLIRNLDAIEAEQLKQSNGMRWQAECNGLQFDGELWLDCQGLNHAAGMAASLERRKQNWAGWSELPVPIRLLVGQTMLSPGAYVSLDINDVVLLDECWLRERDVLTVSVGSGAAFRGRLADAKLTVIENLKNIMQEPSHPMQIDMDEAVDQKIDALPIRLTFDLGERAIPLGELQSLAPGYVFDLGRDMRQSVVIRANGMRVGEGELVDIAGRTGVVVLSLSGRTE